MRLRSGQHQAPVSGDVRPGGARERRLIGEMLDLDTATVAAVVAHQAQTGLLFGEAAIALGVVDDDKVRRAVEEQQGFSVLNADDPRVDPLVVTAFDPDDPLALAARSLRALVTAARRTDGGAVHSIALMGIDTDAETAVLAANLAVACAQTGYTTLLVDADLGNPQQHALFRLRNRQGLTTILSNASRAGTVAQATAIRGLSLISAGPGVPNASELLDRRRLAQGIEPLSDEHSLILVDAGDAASNGISAALGLDATILLVRRDVTESRLLSRVVDRLAEGGMTVLGTIIID